MGEPKALLRLNDQHPTLLEQVVAAVRSVANDVLLIGRPRWVVPASLDHLQLVPDGGHGPADGIIAALHGCANERCFVVGCDMPFLDPALLQEMAEYSLHRQRGVIVRDEKGSHALHALWLRRDLPEIAAMIARGERRLATIAEALGMVALDLSDLNDTARWSVFNVNTPADLEMAREHAGLA